MITRVFNHVIELLLNVAKQQWFQSDTNTDYAVENYIGVENEERKYRRSREDSTKIKIKQNL